MCAHVFLSMEITDREDRRQCKTTESYQVGISQEKEMLQ